MKGINNWDDVQASGDFQPLQPGGYVAIIQKVTNQPDKQYLEIIYDIAEGPEKGRYSDNWGKEHPYAHKFIRSYKDTALGMFRGFIKAVDASNGTTFDAQAKTGINEQELVGKLVGIVLGQEEYRNDFGDIKLRLYVYSTKPAEDIRSNKFNVPEVKRLKTDAPAGTSAPEGFTADDDLPF